MEEDLGYVLNFLTHRARTMKPYIPNSDVGFLCCEMLEHKHIEDICGACTGVS